MKQEKKKQRWHFLDVKHLHHLPLPAPVPPVNHSHLSFPKSVPQRCQKSPQKKCPKCEKSVGEKKQVKEVDERG